MMFKNKYVQLVVIAVATTFMYVAMACLIFNAVLIPRSEEMDKVDLIQKKRAAYYERVEKEHKETTDK